MSTRIVLAKTKDDAERIAKIHFGKKRVGEIWELKRARTKVPHGIKEWGVQIKSNPPPYRVSHRDIDKLVHVKSHTRKGSRGVKSHTRRRPRK